MAFNEKIKVVIDVVADNATSSLKKFRQGISDADTTVGKFKAGASGAFDAVKANAGALAMAGGAALIGFGAKAVSAFQDTALGAGQLRDSLGVTAEEASRLQEVAGDLGIGVGTLESSFGRMLKVAGNTPGEFDAIGASIVKASDGTVDANETFLATIDALNAIKDPAERAAAASKIFGKSWQDMAELIGMGADDVRKALDSVEGGKIIDDREIERARRFRDNLDELKGVGEEVAVVVGDVLVGTINDLVTAWNKAGDLPPVKLVVDLVEASGVNPLAGFIESLKFGPVWDNGPGAILKELTNYQSPPSLTETSGAMAIIADEVARAGDEFAATQAEIDKYDQSQVTVEGSIRDALDAQARQNDELRETRDAARDAADKLYGLHDAERDLFEAVQAASDVLGDQDASLYDVRAGLESVAKAADVTATAQLENAGVTRDTVAGQQAWNREMLTIAATLSGPMQAEVLAHIARVNGIPEDKATSISVLTDALSFDLAEAKLQALARQRYSTLTVFTVDGKQKLASGTRSAKPGLALVGEEGPELVVMAGGERVFNASETEAIANRPAGGVALAGAAPSVGGSSYSITVNAGIGASGADVGRAVVDAIKRYERQNGTGWRAS